MQNVANEEGSAAPIILSKTRLDHCYGLDPLDLPYVEHVFRLCRHILETGILGIIETVDSITEFIATGTGIPTESSAPHKSIKPLAKLLVR